MWSPCRCETTTASTRVVDDRAQLAEHAAATVEQQRVPSDTTRYPLHAPPASCQAGDLPSTLRCMTYRAGAQRGHASLPTAHRAASCSVSDGRNPTVHAVRRARYACKAACS